MDIGIGLPTTIPGVEGKQVTDWARAADEAGFSTLGVIDRIVYPNLEPFVSLAAAAAVTERIRLTTAIAIVPTRHSAALVAKQAASIQELSGGRFVLGAAVGGREDDYEAADSNFNDRGERFEAMLADIERTWQDESGVGPKVDPAPPILIGGSVDAAYKRAARYGAGWIMGGGTPEMLAEGKRKTEAAWEQEGRDGAPRIGGLAYYALGDEAEDAAQRYLGDYYAFLGDYAEQIVQSAAADPDTVKAYVQGFEEAGCDELILFPCSPEPEQVKLLAEAAL